MARVFISYKRADKEKVFPLKDKIEATIGESCWIDMDGIESDAQFAEVIMNAIDKASIVLFMYSIHHTEIKNYTTDWTVRELTYAQDEGKRIVFVNIDQTPLGKWFKFMFPQKQQIDALDPKAFVKLLNDLRNWLGVSDGKNTPLQTSTDAEEHYKLGCSYYYGEGVNQDYTKAVYWYTKAAEQGLAVAQCDLGYCYENGNGVEQDHTKAVYWYTKAAEQGFAVAQYNLGICYKNGEGVTQNYSQVVYWFQKAAEQGEVRAQRKLAVCYENGNGVKQNFVQAVYWYKKAAEQGNKLAIAWLKEHDIIAS